MYADACLLYVGMCGMYTCKVDGKTFKFEVKGIILYINACVTLCCPIQKNTESASGKSESMVVLSM